MVASDMEAGTEMTTDQNNNNRAARRPVIHAMLKGQVILPCDLQPPEPDDAVSLVLWYKDNSMVPIYSVDARSSPVQEARHKPGTWLEGRATFRLSHRTWRNRRHLGADNATTTSSGQISNYNFKWTGPDSPIESPPPPQTTTWHHRRRRQRTRRDGRAPSIASPLRAAPSTGEHLIGQLQIESLASEDNGLYRCRVDFRRARSRFQECELKIIVPADKPSIRDLSKMAAGGPPTPPLSSVASEQQRVGPYDEGAKLVFECETQGGYPEPMLTWWRDGRLVDDSYEIWDASTGRLLGSRKSGAAEGSTVEEFRLRAHLVGSDWGLADNLHAVADHSGQMSQVDGSSTTTVANLMTADSSEADVSRPSSGGANGGKSAEQVTQNRLIRNKLELSGLTRAELLANYSCSAWNTRLAGAPAHVAPTSSVMIDMNLRPIKVQIENERTPVLADKPLEIQCRAYGSRPAALISWHRGSVRLSPKQPQPEQRSASIPVLQIQESISADSNVTTSTLSYVPQIDDGGQIITCRAENPYIRAAANEDLSMQDALPAAGQPAIEDSWKLEVHYLPRATLTLGDKLNDGQIREGNDVYFECSVRAQPSAHEIRWWLDGKELETNITSGLIISNQSLVLQRVQRNQRGRYTCSAINQVGESHSNSVHLRVQYAPFCRDTPPTGDNGPADVAFAALSQQRHKTHYGAARLESVKVYCHIDADPGESLTYKWAFVASNGKLPASAKPEYSGQQLVYLDSQSISSENAASPGGGLVSVATYTPKSELDYGTLLCWAQNSLGQQAEPCAYQIVPAERPDPVRNCRLLNASDTQFAVACEPGYDGGIDQSFHMEVFDSRRHELVANVSSAPLLTSPELSSGTPPSYQNDVADDEAADSPSATRVAGGGQSASLVSGEGGANQQSGGRQQKQRHSTDGSTLKISSKQTGVDSNPNQLEAVFITEPLLRPATDYFLSIYSANSKGSSQPVAFTATTTNHMSASSASISSARADRPLDPPMQTSHLLSDVLSLSWDPFLLVCAVTVALFVLFASVTFALMKYIDFSKSDPQQRGRPSDYGRAGGGLSTNQSSAGGSSAKSRSGAGDNQCNDDAELDALDDERRTQDDLESEVNSSAGGGQMRAKVITVSHQSGALSSDSGNSSEGPPFPLFPEPRLTNLTPLAHMPLNGMQMRRAGHSLLGSSYLRLKFQQLANNLSPAKTGTGMRHSSSDNFINQLDNGLQWASAAAYPEQQLIIGGQPAQRQQLNSLLHGGGGGTLPRNLNQISCSGVGFGSRQPVVAHNPQTGYNVQQISLQSFESPTGAAVAVAPTYDRTSSMMLAPAAIGTSSQRPFYSVGSASVYPSAPGHAHPEASNGGRVEHLLISGKQYVHQRAANYGQARGKHLEVTSDSLEEQQQAYQGPDCQRQLVCIGQAPAGYLEASLHHEAGGGAAATCAPFRFAGGRFDGGVNEQQHSQLLTSEPADYQQFNGGADGGPNLTAINNNTLDGKLVETNEPAASSLLGQQQDRPDGATLHSARLTRDITQNGSGLASSNNNCLLDSDSTGTTQRTTTNDGGSPSSGIAELMSQSNGGPNYNDILATQSIHTNSSHSTPASQLFEPHESQAPTDPAFKSALVVSSNGLARKSVSTQTTCVPFQPALPQPNANLHAHPAHDQFNQQISTMPSLRIS